MEEGWCLSAQRIDRQAVDSLGLSWVLGCISPPSPGSQRRAAKRRLCFCPEAFCLMDAICCLNVQFLTGPFKDREIPVRARPASLAEREVVVCNAKLWYLERESLKCCRLFSWSFPPLLRSLYP